MLGVISAIEYLYCTFSYDCSRLNENKTTRSLGGTTIICDYSHFCGCLVTYAKKDHYYSLSQNIYFSRAHHPLICFEWPSYSITSVVQVLSVLAEELSFLSNACILLFKTPHTFLLFGSSISIRLICIKDVVCVAFLL